MNPTSRTTMPTAAELARRRSLIESVAKVLATDTQQDVAAACQAVGISRGTFYRWQAEFQAGIASSDGQPSKAGRPKRFNLTAEEERALRNWVARRGTLPLAVEEFLRDPACRIETFTAINELMQDALARRLKRVPWPQSIRKAACLTDDEKNFMRGPKHFHQHTLRRHREMTWVDEQGRTHILQPGDMYESDDMSVNEDFRFLDLSDHREKLGRQTLISQDVPSLKFLNFAMIGRSRDAYRVEDIADHMRELVTTCGLPLFWRLELGLWDSSFIHGITTKTGEIWGGLGELFHVVNVHHPNAKGGLEGSFNMLQNLMAHGSLSRGRERGEYEETTRQASRAQRGQADALAKFWSIEQAADGLMEAMNQFNERPKNRMMLGDGLVPNELWEQSRGTKRECPADQLWRFHPVKKELVVDKGQIKLTVPHYPRPFFFRVNGDDLATAQGYRYLPHGFRVLVAFHPGHPEQGAEIFCGDVTTLNREGWSYGQRLVTAQYVPAVPQVDLSGEADYTHQRKANAAVRKEAREVQRAGSAGKRISTARDHYGEAALSQTTFAATDAPTEAPRHARTNVIKLDLDQLKRREAALLEPYAPSASS